jgi:ATP-binding cassette subfamily D (ALD) long-chain fatty acid import protein
LLNKTKKAYSELRNHSIILNWAQLRFGVMEDYIVKYFWGALGFLICALPIFTPFGKPASLRGAEISAENNIADRTGAFFTNRRILLNTSDAFGRLMST